MDIYKLRYILLLVFITGPSHVQGLSKQTNASLSEIPHDQISASENVINLSNNNLTQLAGLEFRRYAQLTVVTLSDNEISTVSATAFCGTQLRNLRLDSNRLTVFPDLNCVANSLRRLYLENNRISTVEAGVLSTLVRLIILDLTRNRLTELPDFTLVSTSSSWSRLELDAFPTVITTVCHFSVVDLRGADSGSVPRFNCFDELSPAFLVLSYFNFSAVTDFSNLTTASFTKFYSRGCVFAEFPELGSLKARLETVQIKQNRKCLYVDPAALQGLDLVELSLDICSLDTIPPEIFHVTQTLSLGIWGAGLWDAYGWGLALCASRSGKLQSLEVGGTINELQHYMPMAEALCKREQQLNVTFHKVSVPCDCSIAWMAEAALRCPVRFLLEHLPCGLSNWTEVFDHLQCPGNFIIVGGVDGEGFNTTEEAFVPQHIRPKTLFVRGERKWVIKDATSGHKWVFGEGVFTAGHDFSVGDGEVSVKPLLSSFTMAGYNESAVTRLCEDSAHNVLMDGLPQSCMSLQPGVQYLSLFPDSSVPRSSGTVMVQTQGLPCSAAFHVMVSAACPHSCPRKHKCELEQTTTSSEAGNTCWYHCACPGTDVTWCSNWTSDSPRRDTRSKTLLMCATLCGWRICTLDELIKDWL